MSTQIEVRKVDLLEDEEMQALIKKVIDALGRNKGKTKKSLALMGIYKGHVIARDFETGRFFKMDMARDDSGNIKLGDAMEVRQVFVPAKQKTEKGEDARECLVAIEGEEGASVVTLKSDKEVIQGIVEDVADEATPEYVEPKESSLWQGVLD